MKNGEGLDACSTELLHHPMLQQKMKMRENNNPEVKGLLDKHLAFREFKEKEQLKL